MSFRGVLRFDCALVLGSSWCVCLLISWVCCFCLVPFCDSLVSPPAFRVLVYIYSSWFYLAGRFERSFSDFCRGLTCLAAGIVAFMATRRGNKTGGGVGTNGSAVKGVSNRRDGAGSAKSNALASALTDADGADWDWDEDDGDADLDECRQCGTDASNGEGWDGLCGNCADRQHKDEELSEAWSEVECRSRDIAVDIDKNEKMIPTSASRLLEDIPDDISVESLPEVPGIEDDDWTEVQHQLDVINGADDLNVVAKAAKRIYQETAAVVDGPYAHGSYAFKASNDTADDDSRRMRWTPPHEHPILDKYKNASAWAYQYERGPVCVVVEGLGVYGDDPNIEVEVDMDGEREASAHHLASALGEAIDRAMAESPHVEGVDDAA